MDRLVYFEFQDHLRATRNGKAVRCVSCDQIIRFERGTHRELRHRCGVADHPAHSDPEEVMGDPLDTDWDDDIGEVEDPLIGELLEFSDDMQGYGEDLQAYTAFTRGNYDPAG